MIIPCYNDGATIRETLDSLTGQGPLEIVVVDDGSNDPLTTKVLDELRADGIRVIRQENQGLSAARMTGVRETTAPYVFPLDSDDMLGPGVISAMADILDTSPRVGVVWGDQETFGEINLVQRRPRNLDPWAITHINQLVSGLIRRTALLEAGGWVLKVGYEDWDLWMGLAEHGWQGRRIDAIGFRYRVSSSRMLSTARASHRDLYEQMRQRHPRLFDERRRNWMKSKASWRQRALIPLVDALPIPLPIRHRASLFVSEPVHAMRVLMARRRGG